MNATIHRHRTTLAGCAVMRTDGASLDWLHDWHHAVAEEIQTLAAARANTGTPPTPRERSQRLLLPHIKAKIARREQASQHARDNQADGFHGDASELGEVA